jgi:hypothetical protein
LFVEGFAPQLRELRLKGYPKLTTAHMKNILKDKKEGFILDLNSKSDFKPSEMIEI